jgi:hypothetical protein
VKTLKDPPQELNKIVDDIKKEEKEVTQKCKSQELSLTKAKEIFELSLLAFLTLWIKITTSYKLGKFCFVTGSRIFSEKKITLTRFFISQEEMLKLS